MSIMEETTILHLVNIYSNDRERVKAMAKLLDGFI